MAFIVQIILCNVLWCIWGKIVSFFRKDYTVIADEQLPLKVLIDKIIVFCEVYSGITYYPYQEQFARRIVRSLLLNDGDEITALFSRQSGKSETVATTVGGCMIIFPILANLFPNDERLQMFKDGLWVGIFAPSERQAKITYNRLRSRLNSKSAKAVLEDPEFNLTFTVSNGQTVTLSNGSFASAISASEGSNIEGESFKCIICEECQDISNYKILKSIHPMGAAYNASIIKVGTSTTFVGNFYEAIQRNKQEYQVNKTVKNHFEYDWKVVVKYNKSYAKYVEKEKKRIGENSDEFQMSYCLKWILVRGMFVSPSSFEKRNIDLSRGVTSYDIGDKTYVAGLDQAKHYDGSVLTIAEVDFSKPVIKESRVNESGEEEEFLAFDSTAVAWFEYQGDYNDQYYAIMDDLKNFNVVRLVADATKEESQIDRFKANLDYEVLPFKFTSQGKSDLYKLLDREIKSGRATVVGDETVQDTNEFKKFQEQLYGLTKNYKGTIMRVENTSEKVHDDYPDSWGLAVYGCSFPIERVEIRTEGENPMFARQQSAFYSGRNRFTSRRR